MLELGGLGGHRLAGPGERLAGGDPGLAAHRLAGRGGVELELTGDDVEQVALGLPVEPGGRDLTVVGAVDVLPQPLLLGAGHESAPSAGISHALSAATVGVFTQSAELWIPARIVALLFALLSAEPTASSVPSWLRV